MSQCPFFKKTTIETPTNEHRSDLQVAQNRSIQRAWCSHPHSPVTQHWAHTTIGGAHALQCGGDVACCQIPAERR